MISSRHKYCVPDTPCPSTISNMPVTLVRNRHVPVYLDVVTGQLVREKRVFSCDNGSCILNRYYFRNLPPGFSIGCGYEPGNNVTPGPAAPSPALTILPITTDTRGPYVTITMDPRVVYPNKDNYLWIWVSKTNPGQDVSSVNPLTAPSGTLSFFCVEVMCWTYDVLVIISVCIEALAKALSGDICMLSTYEINQATETAIFDLAFGFTAGGLPSPLLPPVPIGDNSWALCAQAPYDGTSDSVDCNQSTAPTTYYGFTNASAFTLIWDSDTSGQVGTGYSISEAQSPWPIQTKFMLLPGQTQWIAMPTNAYSYNIGYKVWYTFNAANPPTPASPQGWGYAGFVGVLANIDKVTKMLTFNVKNAVVTNVNGNWVDPSPAPGTPYGLNIFVIPPSPPLPTPVQTYNDGLQYRGVNFSGFDFTPFYPFQVEQTAWFTSQGCNTYRMPFCWEYVQPDLTSAIDWTKSGAWGLYNIVTALTLSGLIVIIDMHNYMRYDLSNPANNYSSDPTIRAQNIIGSPGTGPTTAQYASAWSDIASKFSGNANVMFELMNEPHDITADVLVTNYKAAIKAVRQQEARAANGVNHLLLLCGTHWSCMGNWLLPTINECTSEPVDSNADIFSAAATWDPTFTAMVAGTPRPFGGNWALSVHQYFDLDSFCGSGYGPYVPTSPPSNILDQINFSQFVTYLKTNNIRAFLSETGSTNDETTIAVFKTVLAEVQRNPAMQLTETGYVEGGFIGVTPWSAGQWTGDYILNLNPTTVDGVVTAAPAFSEAIQPLLTPLGGR